jgi:hypothetical protein
VLSGALNFPNSSSLFGAFQAGVHPQTPRLQVREGDSWRELTPDCGVPAGFHEDVVIDLRPWLAEGPATLRITTNLQVSWDRAALWRDAEAIPFGDGVAVPLLRAEKTWLGIPREVKGPGNRWREFPRENLVGASDWVVQGGPHTPRGDVAPLLAAVDHDVAIVRPGEEIQLAFDVGALPAPEEGRERTLVLRTHGWVKDADPHTAHSASVAPLPRPGEPLYP